MDSNNMYQNRPEDNMESNPQPVYGTEPDPQPAYNTEPNPQPVYDAYGNNTYNANSGYGNTNNNYNTANNNYNNANNYNAASYNSGGMAYAQPAYSPEMEEPVSIGEWIIAMLIMMVPCVNIIMMFVFAFGSSSKKSKSNYFKASLIMVGIVFAIYLLLAIVIAAVGAASIF